MPAYAKLSLVTPIFHPSDVAFAREWSRVAPGIGGWTVLLDKDSAAEQVSVIPPGADQPVFFITRQGRDVVLERRRPISDDGEVVEVGRFAGLREAVLALCPLPEDSIEEIQVMLERSFPRLNRR